MPVLVCALLACVVLGCDRGGDAPAEKPPAPSVESACTNVVSIMKREAPESIADDALDKCIRNMHADDSCTDRDAAIACLTSALTGDELVACGEHCR